MMNNVNNMVIVKYLSFGIIVSILVFLITRELVSSNMEKECNSIVKSRVADDLISLEEKQVEMVKFFAAFEIAQEINEIGRKETIDNHMYLCKYWNESFYNLIIKVVESNQNVKKSNLVIFSKEFNKGKNILDLTCSQ